MYSYVDPCTKDLKFITADMNSPIVVVYYNQVRTFSYAELNDGTFELWMNDIYNKYKSTSPCQGAVATTTTTTSTNLASNVVNSVMNLNSIANVGSFTSVGTNVGGTTSTGSGSVSTSENKEDGNTQSNTNPNPNGNNNSDNTNPGGSNGSSGSSGSNGSGSGSSGSGSSSSGSSGSGSGSGKTEEPKTEDKPTDQKVEEQKTETQKQSSGSTSKAASKAKAEVAKPAILVTGDIVGVQKADDGSRDARGTMSLTRVKGDGTASLGLSADYMINAKIGNISVMRSWIGVNKKGNKHINVVSDAFGILPKSWSNTALFEIGRAHV